MMFLGTLAHFALPRVRRVGACLTSYQASLIYRRFDDLFARANQVGYRPLLRCRPISRSVTSGYGSLSPHES
jgi:hypothetical protein